MYKNIKNRMRIDTSKLSIISQETFHESGKNNAVHKNKIANLQYKHYENHALHVLIVELLECEKKSSKTEVTGLRFFSLQEDTRFGSGNTCKHNNYY